MGHLARVHPPVQNAHAVQMKMAPCGIVIEIVGG